tara:strand:+ start:1071 stop:1466 length:396 start_codon:yes stop_codon:yes gene_type:complete
MVNPKLITKLINDYVKTVYEFKKGSTDYKEHVKIIKNEIKDISIKHNIGVKSDIDIVLLFNIFDTVYINSERTMLEILCDQPKTKKIKSKSVRKNVYRRKIKKKDINRYDSNFKQTIIIEFPNSTWGNFNK